MTTIIYVHGFLSSAQGVKVQFLRQKFAERADIRLDAVDFNPTPRDFEFMTVTGEINRLRQFMLTHYPDQPVVLIGSSLGGLVSLNYAHRYGGVASMLLLAPVVQFFGGLYTEAQRQQWEKAGFFPLSHPAFGQAVPLRYNYHLDGQQYLTAVPPAAPTTIIHATADETVPFGGSQHYAATYPEQVTLHRVDSDHGLHNQLDFIATQLKQILE